VIQPLLDELDRLGYIDRSRLGIGGHSYGAFMTANLIAHSDLFRAGIARSGAYNRTLTPFGFQSERRTLWEAPDVYLKLSPFMYADKINHGLANRLSFQATFGDEASAELDELRGTFLVKAFQRRQETLLRYLIEHGQQPATMMLGDLQSLPLDEQGVRLRTRYLDRRDTCARPGEPRAFVDAHGNPLNELAAYLRTLERVSINAEFNGALCRGLLAARFNEDGEPTLLDFARMPARAA